MKLQLVLIVATGLVAGPAAAFSPGFEPFPKTSGSGSSSPQSKPPSYGVPAPSAQGATPRRSAPGGFAPISGAQDPPGARSYKPYTPDSGYAPPSRAKPGCEQSVYAGACDKR